MAEIKVFPKAVLLRLGRGPSSQLPVTHATAAARQGRRHLSAAWHRGLVPAQVPQRPLGHAHTQARVPTSHQPGNLGRQVLNRAVPRD